MIFFVILGIALGIISVVFVAQNTEMVTVSFLNWQFDGSLAVVLLLTLASGAVMTLLILMPSFIKDAFVLSSVKRKKNALEKELATTQETLRDATARPAPPPEAPSV